MIAMMSLGVSSLTARIAELRRQKDEQGKDKYVVSDEWVKDYSQRRYKTYWLGTERPKDDEPTNNETAAS